MDIFNIAGQEYYSANGTKAHHKELFKGCLASVGKIIDRYELTSEYLYARSVNGALIPGRRISNKLDKLYLSKEWVDSKLVELGLVENRPMEKAVTDQAPDILELRDSEKITDDEGNVYDIEVRGERHPEKIFFKVKDISSKLNIPNLGKTLKHPDTNYKEGRHYVKLYNNDGINFIRRRYTLFVTYKGFIKVLNSTSNNKCDKFLDWATEVVFTAHLGTKPQKQALAGKLLGVDRQTVRAVFNKSTTEQSCIYLIYLGKASELRVPFEIGADFDDNSGVYKYGRAISLSKRLDQHQAHYGKLLGRDVKLTKYAPIDPIYNVEAENDIKAFFIENECKLDNKKHVELVILDKLGLNLAKAKYKEISDEYMGHYQGTCWLMISKPQDQFLRFPWAFLAAKSNLGRS